jgi:hypothetical protein
LLERVREVERADFFAVLKFQKLIAAMTCHVDKYVRAIVCKQALGPRHVRFDSTYSPKRREWVVVRIFEKKKRTGEERGAYRLTVVGNSAP